MLHTQYTKKKIQTSLQQRGNKQKNNQKNIVTTTFLVLGNTKYFQKYRSVAYCVVENLR